MLWIKAFHIIAVISWMAGLLYLPRLFVYHASNPKQARTFETMETRLLKLIMTPAMLASLFFGLWLLALNPYLIREGWFLAKLACILGLIFCHFTFAHMRKDLARGKALTPRAYRIWNEAPTALMVAIVILAVVKP